MRGWALACCVFLPFALGHFMSALLRTVNAVLAPELMAELGLSVGQLGLLSSGFFFAFALVQLPVGLALDRFGPRRVQLLLLVIAAGAAFWFGSGASFGSLAAARFLLGVGLGGCFMAALKALSGAVEGARLPVLQGYLIAAGGLGAATATLPARALVGALGWRGVFCVLALAVLLVAALIWFLAPRTHVRPPGSAGVGWRKLWSVPSFRQVVLLMVLPHAVFFGMQGFWIGRWLAQAGLSERSVAILLYLGMAAVIFGAIGVGMLTAWAQRRGIAGLDLAAAGLLLFVGVQALMVLEPAGRLPMLAVSFTLVGTVCGMDYALVAQAVPPAWTGRAATCLNLLIFLGAFAVQAGFAAMVALWPYKVGWAVLVALQLPGLFWFARGRMPASAHLGDAP